MSRNRDFHWPLPKPGEGFDYYVKLFRWVARGLSFRIPDATIETMKQCGPAHQWGTFTRGLCYEPDCPISRTAVTACVMTRNAARTLEPCLQSIRSWADELIVLDSGSDDGTPELAREFTDRVFFRTWPESYADQRNHLISMVRTEWMVMIDADEVLQAGFGDGLRRFITFADQEEFDVLWLPRLWVTEFEEHPDPSMLDVRSLRGHWLFFPDPQARVARMTKHPFYRGPIHEELHLNLPGSALLIGVPEMELVHLRLVSYPFEERERVVAQRNIVDPGGVHNLQLLPELGSYPIDKRTMGFEDPALREKIACSGRVTILSDRGFTGGI